MNIKFEKDGIIKETHEKFTEELVSAGWEVLKETAPKKKPSPKKTKAKSILKKVIKK